MKIEDAIEHVILAKGRFLDSPEKYEALHMAIGALEKQIPKPPLPQNQYDVYLCPTCNTRFNISQIDANDYCVECGQALKWGGAE